MEEYEDERLEDFELIVEKDNVEMCFLMPSEPVGQRAVDDHTHNAIVNLQCDVCKLKFQEMLDSLMKCNDDAFLGGLACSAYARRYGKTENVVSFVVHSPFSSAAYELAEECRCVCND